MVQKHGSNLQGQNNRYTQAVIVGTRTTASDAEAKPHLIYLPQSFPGIVWHQQLAGAVAAAVGVVAGAVAGAGEIRETKNAMKVSMELLFLFS